MEMPGQGFLFIATVLVPENAGTKAQLPKIEVTRKHWDIYIYPTVQDFSLPDMTLLGFCLQNSSSRGLANVR